MRSVEQRARELLAESLRKHGRPRAADAVLREGRDDFEESLDAIAAALREQPEADPDTKWDRESLGRIVRDEWEDWAREQPNPKPSWLTPWHDLTEPEREVDRRIGERLAKCVLSLLVTGKPLPQVEQPEARGVVDDAMVERGTAAAISASTHYARHASGDAWRFLVRDVLTAALTAAQQPVQEGGGEVCPRCKGAGEYEGFARHASGDPQDEYAATVQCEPCEGTGEVAAPPSAPVGVDGLAGLLEQIRDLLASLPVDCLGTDTAADGQPYPIRDEVIHSITKALTQQPAQAAPGDDDSPEKDVAVWELIRIAEECGAQKDSDDDHTWWSLDLHAFYKLEDRMTDAVSRMRYAEAATPPGDDAAGGGHG